MDFRSFLKNNTVVLDGGMGTLLQERGLSSGELPERWNISHSDVITAIHKEYFDSGANVVLTNTFGANSFKFSDEELDLIIKCSLENADKARKASSFQGEKFIALDIGPTGKLLKPLGTLGFEEAVAVFKKTARLGAKYGADLILIETVSDSYEAKAALLAAKEACELPVIVSCAFGSDGKLLTGASPSAVAAMLEGMGADAIGANCSCGPGELMPVLEEFVSVSSVPVLIKPNAGLPTVVDGKSVYRVSVSDFVSSLEKMLRMGARLIGGCCGTTPEFIAGLRELADRIPAAPLSDKNLTVISSYTHAVNFGKEPVLIGERINPTGKKRFKEALVSHDIDYIISEGLREEESGAHVLDVNVGLPEIDEEEMLLLAITELQTVTALPLSIDTSNPVAMEAALRRYNGKALINSVNGKEESMEKIFPLMKKYGGVAIALTLDENGIPETADGRVKIAEKIIQKAKEYGISKNSLIFDTLTLTVATNPDAAKITLDALSRIKNELGCHTSLGVSNVSFGLPARDFINASFFSMALSNGLSAAIMNPHSSEMMKSYYAHRALSGLDRDFSDYIKRADSFAAALPAAPKPQTEERFSSKLGEAIIKGMKEKAKACAEELLKTKEPLFVVENEIIPAINAVGDGYEKKTVYLPSLLASAEAAKYAFEKVKEAMLKNNTGADIGEKIVIATVKGDIHDIGKNIVKLILENYSYKVIDLGKDVPPAAVLDAVVSSGARIVGLSALMTTTVPAMEETIALLKEKVPFVKVMVGGAVMTEEIALKIGADAYAKDAISAVKLVEKFIEK
ncbi:MAG: homocysteine S-methyltransferase family protein [Clostridia bacterium]|nr:homocysteine S-methyltransferase family protein [Clostridia bacterium]